MNKKLTVIFSSHLSDDENNNFVSHVKETAGVADLAVEFIVNKNQYSLPEAYNKVWKKVKEDGRGDGVLVFCHNDIIFKTKDWGKILLGMFNGSQFDILGIAGTTQLNAHGCWWLKPENELPLSEDKMNRARMFGRVWHCNALGREWESVYSEKIVGVKPVVTIDGLFIAVNGKTLGEKEEQMFDERFKGFHFYDISFCFRNYLEGFDIGVIDRIKVMHKSVGETNSEWELNREQFCQMYKDELPASI
jgi:hypothetical protein